MKKTTFSLLIIAALSFAGCEKEPLIEPTNTGTKTTTTTNTGGSSTGTSGTGCTSVQCYATAKSTGNRCKNKTTYCNGRCYAHQ